MNLGDLAVQIEFNRFFVKKTGGEEEVGEEVYVASNKLLVNKP